MTEAVARLRVVTPPELAPGFRMGGATVHTVDSADQAAEMVDALVTEGERGVIGVYAPWFDEFDRLRRARLEDSIAPIVVAVPSGLMAESDADRRARLAGLLQRAIGYHITFEERE